MAEIKPIQLVPSIATPFKDSRAEGYVSYYTKVGWDRWNLALQQVEQDVKDRKLEYDAAMDLYRDQLKAIADEKQYLQKKIDDIKLKKADVAARRADILKRMEESRILKKQAEETEKAKSIARVPSVGSGGGGGGGVGPTGIKVPLDEALDEITGGNRTVVDDRLRTLAGGVTSANAGERFNQLKGYYDTGGLPADASTKDITSYALFDAMAKDIASKEGKSIDEVKSNLILSASQEIRDQIKRGAARVEAIAERQAGVSAGTYSSKGSYQTDYEIAQFGDLAALDLEAKEYDKIEKEIADRLEKKNNIPIPLTPTIEPIDLITAARKTYLDKFGNIPEGVSLRAGGESVARYKELMPFEITNALKGVQSFFQGYIDREISTAKALSPSGFLTKDETSFAIERGKTAARKALFGTVYTPQEKARVDAGLPPQAEDSSKALEEELKKEGVNVQDLTKGRRPPEDAAGVTAPATESTAGVTAPATEATKAPTPTTAPATKPAARAAQPAKPTTPPAPIDAFVGPPAPPELITPNAIPALTDSMGSPSLEELSNIEAFLRKYGYPTPTAPTTQTALTDSMGSPSLEELSNIEAFLRKYAPPTTPTARTTPTVPKTVPVPGSLSLEDLGNIDALLGKSTLPSFSAPNRPPPKNLPPPPMVPTSELSIPLTAKNAADRSFVGVPEKAAPPKTPEQKSTQQKADAFMQGAEKAQATPSAAARDLLKDSVGKYVSAAYEANKAKGPGALPLSDLTSQIISEYSGDMKNQAKAVRLLTQIAYLDDTKNQIK